MEEPGMFLKAVAENLPSQGFLLAMDVPGRKKVSFQPGT